jgi:acetylornithine deacetylase/succinyl-diaminopimelate desuccinylase-like protein
MNESALLQHITAAWRGGIVDTLQEYIRIPAKSPLFDADWEAAGHIEAATRLLADWCSRQPIPGLRLEVLRLPGRTPLLYLEVPGSGKGTVLLYGHLDKQPEMSGWREDLGPWQPVVDNGRLYGRGGADDGYAVFAALGALAALQAQGVAHARCIILIEASEESGSPDLPAYLENLLPRIGKPDLVIALDSGCGNYEQLWLTTSLRGLIGGTLEVGTLTEGVHSGDAGGIVPSSFAVARTLLARIEDAVSGRILPAAFHAPIPETRRAQAQAAADALGDDLHQRFPFTPGTRPLGADNAARILARSWQPALEITGADGLPAIASAGNVLRPRTALKVSLRLPPTVDAAQALQQLQALLLHEPPHGAQVRFTPDWAAQGWHAPPLAPWLEQAVDAASRSHYGRPALHMGEGATIPFMHMLGAQFPQAQFLITGVLGPQANAHGPNEFLHLDYAARLSACVASVIARHHQAQA